MNPVNTSQANVPSMRREAGAGALWASAFVLFALIVLQAGRLAPGSAGGGPIGSSAYAGLVSQTGDITVLTAASGDNDDILTVLDRRGERLLVYNIKNGREVELLQNYDLSRIFVDAREAAGQVRRP